MRMYRRICYILLGCLFLHLPFALAHEGLTDDSHFEAFNMHQFPYGYSFNIYPTIDGHKVEEGIFHLYDGDEEFTVDVASWGQDRQLALQVYVNYVQVPIMVENVTTDIFYIEAVGDYNSTFKFRLAEPLCTNTSHKMLAVLTAGPDVHACQTDFPSSNTYAIAIDNIVSFAQAPSLHIPSFNYEVSKAVKNYKANGFLLHTEPASVDGKIMEKQLTVRGGEEFTLYYQVGGIDDLTNEVLLLINVGFEQAKINEQDFLVITMKPGEVMRGEMRLKAPMKSGLYDVMGYMVNDPFSDIPHFAYQPFLPYRFTLIVK